MFLDTVVYEGTRFNKNVIPNVKTHFQQTETHRNWKPALLIQNSKGQKEMLSFVTQYQPLVSTLIEALMEKRNLIQNHYTELCQIFKEPPIISHKKGKSWQRC